MLKTCYIAIFALLFSSMLSCTNNRPTSAEENEQVKNENPGQVAAVIDSINKVKAYIPPVFDKEYFDSAATKSFYDLARKTDGELKLLINSKLVANEIANIISKYATDGADIVLLIDQTGSMEDDIQNVKAGLKQVIDAVKEHRNVRLALAFYGDKNVDGIYWFLFKDVGSDYALARNMLQSIDVTGGGDIPESVYDAFFEVNKMDFWRSGTKRMIVLVGDAPPLEKPLSDYSLKDVVERAKEGKIEMNFYPIIVTPHNGDDITHPAIEYKDSALISTLYPNPTNGLVHMQFASEGRYDIKVLTSSGDIVFHDLVSGDKWQHDFSALANGIYIVLAVNSDHFVSTARFLLTH